MVNLRSQHKADEMELVIELKDGHLPVLSYFLVLLSYDLPKGIHMAAVLGDTEHIEGYTKAHHLRCIIGAGRLKSLLQ